ncbi:MAG: DUF559 domain-containing protein, partial [Cellulomonas sp.]
LLRHARHRTRFTTNREEPAYHGQASFQSDRTRQNRLVNAGFTVLRFTWQDLTDRPAEVLRQIRAALTRLSTATRRTGPVSRGM